MLLSATTAALVSGAMPDGVSKRDLGEVRLKDIDEPERVTQLEIDGLPESFPPLRVEQEEPMDFGERLAQKIQADVERQIEASLGGSGCSGPDDRLALFGLVNVVLIVAAIVVIVALIKLVV